MICTEQLGGWGVCKRTDVLVSSWGVVVDGGQERSEGGVGGGAEMKTGPQPLEEEMKRGERDAQEHTPAS